MRNFATKQFVKDSAQQEQQRNYMRSRFVSPLSTAMPQLQRQCACGGGCPRCKEELGIQTQLKISEPGDQYEQEANRVADQVMRMPEPSVQREIEPEAEEEMLERKAIPEKITPLVQRQILPAMEEENAIDSQTTPPTSTQESSAVPSSVHEVLSSPGQLLDPVTRGFMESRFGHDFSQVRVYSGTNAEQSAREVKANAYTVGHNMVFGASQFAPQTNAGRWLIAHELTHVVQQSGADGIHTGHGNEKRGLFPIHQPSAGALAIQRDDSGGGSTEFQDRVTVLSRPTSGPGIIRGTVTRIETAPASGSQPQEEIHRGEMNVTFDPSDCSITIPFGYNFVQAAQAANTGICDDPPSTTAVPLLSTDAFNRLKTEVLTEVNRGLNGWFDVRLSGDRCPSGCADRTLPIHVDAHEDTANPDTTITVVNRGGRANAATICAASWDRSTAVHEGGHQVLGLGDEYPETDERLRATVPQWFRPERVRRDYSVMGPEQHSRFAMFHERHFNGVKTFLEDAFPGCTTTLQGRPRPVIPDYRIVLGGGYASLSGLSGSFLQAGLRLGIPLDRLRHWEIVLGPQFNWINGSGDSRRQQAFLLGARLGLEGSTGEGGHGFTAGVFGDAGYGWFSSTDYRRGVTERSATAMYGELGFGAGYRTPILDGSTRFTFNVEGAAGTTIGSPGIIGPITREIESDPARSSWFRLGLSVGGQF